ncbi:MAG TPA: esterase [Cellvibrio sp.]|nr:esterase [Cellvibrio sp.]
MRKVVFGLLMSSAILTNTVYSEDLPAFSLPNSEVRTIHANSNKKDYELYIQLPSSYKNSTASYPLIIVNDAIYAFPMASGVMQFMGGQVIQEAVLVGISASKGDDRGVSRTRDYTPTFSPMEKSGHSSASRLASGHAKEYVDFIADQVIPLMQKKYRIDSNNKIFVGHSFGGLLGSYILVNRPEVFDRYIIGSPSLWYDNKVIFEMEKKYAEKHKTLRAHVMIYADQNDSSLNNKQMADDALAFEKALRSRNYTGLNLQVEIIKDENHHSVFPGLLSRGLMAAIPLKK